MNIFEVWFGGMITLLSLGLLINIHAYRERNRLTSFNINVFFLIVSPTWMVSIPICVLITAFAPKEYFK